MTVTFFWLCLAIVVYTYIGYGIVLYLLVFIKRLATKAKPLADISAEEFKGLLLCLGTVLPQSLYEVCLCFRHFFFSFYLYIRKTNRNIALKEIILQENITFAEN